MHTLGRIRAAAAAATAALMIVLAVPGPAHAATTITQDSLTPTSASPGISAKATLKVHSTSCTTVQQLGVAVRDSAGRNFDFPNSLSNVTICPSGFTYTSGARTFLAGTYTEFGYYLDSTGFHNLPPETLTVAPSSGNPSNPAQGKTLTFDEEFNQPIAFGTRWIGTTTSAYQYGNHNPNDDKLDWLQQSAVTVANGVATFTAQPSSHILENGKRAWNTGLLTTEGSSEGFQVRTNDYIETRVQMPSGLGAWPALWSWRNGDTEIDKYEYHPDNPNLLELTNHINPSLDYYTNAGAVAPGNWVVIGVLYGANSVNWYVNGAKVFSDNTGVGTSFSAYLILNLSVDAGEYHPAPPNNTPITSAADYVRVYR
ncbi:family 16 glycosylhydrolase [Kitasatospora sp. GP82]|uniref:glycoside hydrolase family 16 protein n=1 Tax=Kitasatospora sp. GP82 TaxID=3035089 RepID=UPI002473EC97|nr:family 16 glycosylhydrolase [Kitasatospora sp. GP82]MDH6130416.1 hypothetical protein [Kitasatospora sp. GP82]